MSQISYLWIAWQSNASFWILCEERSSPSKQRYRLETLPSDSKLSAHVCDSCSRRSGSNFDIRYPVPSVEFYFQTKGESRAARCNPASATPASSTVEWRLYLAKALENRRSVLARVRLCWLRKVTASTRKQEQWTSSVDGFYYSSERYSIIPPLNLRPICHVPCLIFMLLKYFNFMPLNLDSSLSVWSSFGSFRRVIECRFQLWTFNFPNSHLVWSHLFEFAASLWCSKQTVSSRDSLRTSSWKCEKHLIENFHLKKLMNWDLCAKCLAYTWQN